MNWNCTHFPCGILLHTEASIFTWSFRIFFKSFSLRWIGVKLLSPAMLNLIPQFWITLIAPRHSRSTRQSSLNPFSEVTFRLQRRMDGIGGGGGFSGSFLMYDC